MMKKLTGLFVALTLTGSSMALAKGYEKQHRTQTQTQPSTGGSGTQTGQLGTNQLTGRVVKSDRNMVWVEHAGAIVPLKVDKNTQFADPNLKRASDLKEGDEIRASFEVRKTDNIATSIEKSTGMGGSGKDVMKPDQGINQPQETLPPQKGTGGTGQDMGPDVTPDQSQHPRGAP